MKVYNIDRILSFVALNGMDISPADRWEWVKFGCALKFLGYSEDMFVTLSSGAAKDSRQQWKSERTPGRYFNNDPGKAAGFVVNLAKEAGIELNQFLLSHTPCDQVITWRATRTKTSDQVSYQETRNVVYVPDLEISRYEENVVGTALYKFLCSRFDEADVMQAVAAYRIGGYDEISTFPLINGQNLCVDVRLCAYMVDGHRDKNRKPTYHLAERHMSEHRGEWPLFGEHLLSLSPDKPVGIVESEKSALIASIALPGYVWVATNSMSNLNERRCAAVKGRECYVFPDLDGILAWRGKSEHLAALGYDIHFCDEYIRENALPGSREDIADIIIRAIDNERESEQ